MEGLILNFGYAGLFAISFLAATLLPFGSEPAVVLAAMSDFSPVLILIAASAGNFFGALVNFGVGRWGRRFLFSRYIRVKPHQLDRAEFIIRRWGSPVLFFAWVPVIGDPLTLVAGMFNMNIYVFSFWVLLGKSLRYLFVLKGVALAVS